MREFTLFNDPAIPPNSDAPHPADTPPDTGVPHPAEAAPARPAAPQLPELDAEAILQGLNASQREAAAETEGPVMIIAGAGSGKTRALTYRIAYLLATGRAKPWQILALTFTNKAAREMRERIEQLVGPAYAKGLWMGTFHSIFARILRREADHLGYTRDFTIYDSEDSERVIKSLMPRFHVDPKQFTPRTMRSLISGAKNQLVTPGEYASMAYGPAEEKAAQLYGPYQQALKRANAMDFDDLLVLPIRLFEEHPDVLQQYQQKWRYLHIDEYQDTNRAQYQITKQLAARHKNICVVGDDAQSIYAFRGADIRNILDFKKDYPDAKIVRLEQNYRSTKKILQLADSIIKHNQDQLDKTLWTDNRDGEPILLMEAVSERDEAQKIERTIRDLRARAGYPWKDYAVLYRTNAQSRALEEALRKGGIPYRLVGGVNFYQRKEIKDVLAYLRLTVNPNDAESVRRVINYPTRGIGAKSMQGLVAFARDNNLTLWQALERAEDVPVGPRAQKAMQKFHFLIAKHAARAGSTPADELARDLISETGLTKALREENTVESLARWENVQELFNAIAEFTEARASADHTPTLSEFLQEVTLLTDADKDTDDRNKVTLMTMHASKGLEFPVVFVSGLEEGLFPLAKAAQDRQELEEERRLFYVGATRAEERLYLSYARSRFRFGQQEPSIKSRFLDEIDTSVVKTERGGRYERRTDRFQLGARPSTGKNTSYEGMDPDYWKKAPEKTAAKGYHVEYDAGEGGGIVPGVKVQHRTFGQGKVLAVEGTGERAKATVFFKNYGQKKLVLKYARLQRLG